MDTKVVSVIIPCYKQAQFLKEAIDSVLVQTYPRFEIIVVDDGSPDNISAILEGYTQVKYIKQANQGAAIARNTGIKNSCGHYLIFLDADDRLLPGAILSGVDFLADNPAHAFVTGQVTIIDTNGIVVDTPAQPTVEKDHYQTLLRSNYIWTPGVVMYRRSVFENQRGFDPTAGGSADYELNIRLARFFAVGCHGKVVLEYRQHQTNMSSNLAYMLKSGVSVRRRQYQYIKDNPALVGALRQGIRTVQQDVGERLINDLLHSKRNGTLLKKKAIRDLMCLCHYYPRGALKFFWLFFIKR
jgi:glycosyltransferase involved in cell wall biosynthesis